MSGVRPIPYRKVARALRNLGFEEKRQKGSHVLFEHPDGRVTVVPNHPGEDVGRGLLRTILNQIEVEWDEFEKNL